MFQKGDKVVYPTHGIGLIEDIIEKSFQGGAQSFYIIKIADSGVKIMTPKENAEKVGLRAISDSKKINKAMRILKEEASVLLNENWNKRQKGYLMKIKTGCILGMAEVYRDLTLLQIEKALSFGERKILENVRQLLVSEIAEAKGIESPKAMKLIEKAVSH